MEKLKVYLDTSVISHLFADDTPDKMADTHKLWQDLISGKHEVFISTTVANEVAKCSEPKRTKLLAKLNEIVFTALELTHEIAELAEDYINGGVLTQKSIDDCRHIAFAVANNCDVIVSWNFKHLVNYKTINKVKMVNAVKKYKEIGIITPTMLLEESELE